MIYQVKDQQEKLRWVLAQNMISQLSKQENKVLNQENISQVLQQKIKDGHLLYPDSNLLKIHIF